MIEWLGYFEEVKTLTYREEDGINIPKSVRERAFSLQVDVEIVSTDGNDYLNFKSAPAYGFYGYAVLVFRDHADIQIPINQPRQRLYYGRVSEAYVNWFHLFNERIRRSRLNEIVVALGSIWGALGLEDFPLVAEPCPLWSGFEELPLREVYVKTRRGTQFNLEVSHWYPVIRTGDDDGCSYDGKSQQVDGDKDDGLPENGSQPQNASDPNNPYAGLPDPTSPFDEGEFSNSKISGVDSPNPDNTPEPPEEPTQTCEVTVTVPFISNTFVGTISGLPSDVTFEVVRQLFPISSTVLHYGIRVVNGVGNTNVLGWYDGSGTLSPTPAHWSQSETFVSAVCELE